MNTPVLFIIFNRPDTTTKVFAAIRKAKPDSLFIAADGPREDKPGEKEKCEETRRITEKIDWPCEVSRLYRNKNLGCKIGVSSAIDWFFENVEEGIILEDDCLPDKSFFKYCSILLNKYRNNQQIMHISGNSFVKIQRKKHYYFSRYPHIWGWATWKRAWNKYDINMTNWNDRKKSILDKYCFKFLEKVYWRTIFDMVNNNEINTWDYQWVYSIWNSNGYAITPYINLVKNIGFSPEATHTKNAPIIYRKMKANNINIPLIHPKKININDKNDIFTNNKIFRISPQLTLYLFISHIISLLKK